MCVCVFESDIGMRCDCTSVSVSLHTEKQYLRTSSKVRTFFGPQNLFSGPHDLKGLFEG